MIERQRHEITIVLKLKCCFGKNSVICSNCTGNKGIVIVTSKMGYEVCARINGQQSIVGTLIKDTGVLKGQ